MQRAENILEASGVKLVHRAQGHAFYRPGEDAIYLPEKKQFSSEEGYYSTALHELSHWTGHESRLNREFGPFGSIAYAKEELRAEIGSMMISGELGIGQSVDDHAAYVQSWIKILRDDPREVFRAAADAEKIMDYVMEFEHTGIGARAPIGFGKKLSGYAGTGGRATCRHARTPGGSHEKPDCGIIK